MSQKKEKYYSPFSEQSEGGVMDILSDSSSEAGEANRYEGVEKEEEKGRESSQKRREEKMVKRGRGRMKQSLKPKIDSETRDSLKCHKRVKDSSTDSSPSKAEVITDQENSQRGEKEVKRGRDLMKQSIKMPYYMIPKPSFREFTLDVAKNLSLNSPSSYLVTRPPCEVSTSQSVTEAVRQIRSPSPEIVILDETPASNPFLPNPVHNLIRRSVIHQNPGRHLSAKATSLHPVTSRSLYGLTKEQLIKFLLDQAQSKREEAFNKHKEMQKAFDEEQYASEESDESLYTPAAANATSSAGHANFSYGRNSSGDEDNLNGFQSSGVESGENSANSFKQSTPNVSSIAPRASHGLCARNSFSLDYEDAQWNAPVPGCSTQPDYPACSRFDKSSYQSTDSDNFQPLPVCSAQQDSPAYGGNKGTTLYSDKSEPLLGGLSSVNSMNYGAESFLDPGSPMCFSLPSYQPGGGFADQPNDSNDENSDCDIGLHEPIYNDCYNEHSDCDELPDQTDPNSHTTTPSPIHFEQVYDSQPPSPDLSQICSGQFEDDQEIPWTPSSTWDCTKDNSYEKKVQGKITNIEQDECKYFEDTSKDLNVGKGKRKVKNSVVEEQFSLQNKKQKFNEEIIDETGISLAKKEDEAAESLAACEDGADRNLATSKNEIDGYLAEDDEADESLATDEEEFAESLVADKDGADQNLAASEDETDGHLAADDETDLSLAPNEDETCKTLPADKDEADENLAENEGETDQNSVTDEVQKNYFIDDEAELSGEEASSDESENENEREDQLFVQDVADDVPLNESVLKEQVDAIYRKHLENDDTVVMKKLKERFLPEGELYSENGSRKKNFSWNFNSANQVIENEKNSGSESDLEENPMETVQQDKMKWKKENANLQSVDDNEEAIKPDISKIPVNIIGKGLQPLGNSFGGSCHVLGKSADRFTPNLNRLHGSMIRMGGRDMAIKVEPGVGQNRSFVFSAQGPTSERASTSKGVTRNSILDKL